MIRPLWCPAPHRAVRKMRTMGTAPKTTSITHKTTHQGAMSPTGNRVLKHVASLAAATAAVGDLGEALGPAQKSQQPLLYLSDMHVIHKFGEPVEVDISLANGGASTLHDDVVVLEHVHWGSLTHVYHVGNDKVWAGSVLIFKS